MLCFACVCLVYLSIPGKEIDEKSFDGFPRSGDSLRPPEARRALVGQGPLEGLIQSKTVEFCTRLCSCIGRNRTLFLFSLRLKVTSAETFRHFGVSISGSKIVSHVEQNLTAVPPTQSSICCPRLYPPVLRQMDLGRLSSHYCSFFHPKQPNTALGRHLS